MSNQKYDYSFKILLIGDAIAGKTSFLLRYADDSFTANNLTTTGIDFKIKIININGKLIKLQIWDTAGQEGFNTISKTYYKGAHGIILFYDIGESNSFRNIPNYMKQIETNAPNITCKVLVGNNCERPDRVVTEEHGKRVADNFSMAFFEASPKTNQNINEVVNYLVQEILKSIEGKK